VDEDGDGYGDPASEGCPHPQADCDDTDPAVHPGVTEGPPGDATCRDGKDNDCDLDVDTEDGGCVNGSCTPSAAASVAAEGTKEGRDNGPALQYLLLPLAMAGILLRSPLKSGCWRLCKKFQVQGTRSLSPQKRGARG
jgi:hypothetical protein